jgi:hypothetical protein
VQKSDELPDSILEIKMRFRSVGKGESELGEYGSIPKLIGFFNQN